MTATIYHVSNPRLPQFRFEWHPHVRKVYLIRLGSRRDVGDPIADNVETHGAAVNTVLVWSRGYHEARRAIQSNPTTKHGAPSCPIASESY